MLAQRCRHVILSGRFAGAVSAQAYADVLCEPRAPRKAAVYFVVTVFATVGFGDITAVSQIARVLVTLRRIADLLVPGLVIRGVATALRRGRHPSDERR